MTVDERHRRLHRKLEDVLGVEEADTLMDALTSRDIQMLDARMAAGFAELRKDLALVEARLRAEFADRTNDQTKTLFRTFIVSNAAMILAVAMLAFGRAVLP